MSTFLTVENLKTFTAISKNVDPSLLDNFIPIAEEMHIEPILGLALSDKIKYDIDNGSLSGVNETLLEIYILPASAWYSFYEASTFLAYRTEAKGMVKKSSENSETLDQREFSAYKQGILDKATFYKNRLVTYLENNRDTYQLYRSAGEHKPHSSNSTGFFLG